MSMAIDRLDASHPFWEMRRLTAVHIYQNITKHKYKEVISRRWNTLTRNDVLLDLALQECSHVTESQDVDEMVDSYHKTITTTLDIHCPIKRRKVRTDNCFPMTSLIDKPKKARK